MKARVALLAVLVLLAAVSATAQVTMNASVRNGLAMLDITPDAVVKVEPFSYGAYMLSASGEKYLPKGTMGRWYADIDATDPEQILLFQGFYDSIPFPNARMNSSENLNLAEDRTMPGFQYAIETGKGRLSLLLPPGKAKREARMYRVTVKPAPKQLEYAKLQRVEEMNGIIIELAEKVKRLEMSQYRPPDPVPAPFDKVHLFAGYGWQGTGQNGASGFNVSLSLPMLEQIQLGALLNGAYEGQGGLTVYGEWVGTLSESKSLCLVGGASVSIFRKLNTAKSPRSLRYGQVYCGLRGYVPLFGDRLLEITFAVGPNAEVLMTPNGGMRFTDHSLGSALRFAVMVF